MKNLDSVFHFTMVGRWNLLILAMNLSFFAVVLSKSCPNGYTLEKRECVDYDECAVDDEDPDDSGPCGENAVCHNTVGSFFCQCANGFRSSAKTLNFSAETSATCKDINECLEFPALCGHNALCFNTIPNYICVCDKGYTAIPEIQEFRQHDNVTCRDINECQEDKICGQNAMCINTVGSYYCVCNPGYSLKSGRTTISGDDEQCEVSDICMIDKAICGNGTCHRDASGHYCACHTGFTNYGNKGSHCIALNCDTLLHVNNLPENFASDLVIQLKRSCLELTINKNTTDLDKDDILKRLMSMIDELLSSGAINDNRKVSAFLHIVENVLKLAGPFIEPPGVTRSSTYTELELLVRKGPEPPQGAVTLSSKQVQVDIQLETAAGDHSYYPGFTTVSLLSFANLQESADGYFSGMEQQRNQRFEIISKVLTITVSNQNTSHLIEPVNITFYNLTQSNGNNHTCVFWDLSVDKGSWSAKGCSLVESNREYTVCSCNHLSSFAVLMALYEMEDKFELQLITWVGLSLSLFCLLICILTFSLIRSIQGPRTTIHLHLSISLFIATFIFLVGITPKDNRVGCAVVAGLLHFFYLAAFCWMCLEGIQLFRMVVLVFNTNFKTLYVVAGGYGVPAVIVGISALVNAEGYGTERHCWLNLKFIWSFFGPACVVIFINIFFFLITVWKLAQKFSSLNPDLDNLQKIKTFTITAVAQLCVLGTMWIFGCFQLEEGTIAMSYLFTIFGSLQGVLLFVMHCLFSKQVREEYGNILSKLCVPKKKRYSQFNSNSSKAHASRSTQDTGESHI